MRRIAVVSLALLSAFSLVNKANAAPENIDIYFDGTIGSVCQFSNPFNGTITQSSPTSGYIEAAGGFTSESGIATSVGTSGKITLNCTVGGSVSVAAPVALTVPTGFTSSNASAFADNGTAATRVGSNFSAGSTNPLTIPAGSNVDLNIGLSVGNKTGNTGVPSGSYSYRVTVTATPN